MIRRCCLFSSSFFYIRLIHYMYWFQVMLDITSLLCQKSRIYTYCIVIATFLIYQWVYYIIIIIIIMIIWVFRLTGYSRRPMIITQYTCAADCMYLYIYIYMASAASFFFIAHKLGIALKNRIHIYECVEATYHTNCSPWCQLHPSSSLSLSGQVYPIHMCLCVCVCVLFFSGVSVWRQIVFFPKKIIVVSQSLTKDCMLYIKKRTTEVDLFWIREKEHKNYRFFISIWHEKKGDLDYI